MQKHGQHGLLLLLGTKTLQDKTIEKQKIPDPFQTSLMVLGSRKVNASFSIVLLVEGLWGGGLK